MPTHYKGSPAEVLALNAYITLIRAAESVTARITTHLAETPLTVTQFGVLDALYHLGPLCQRDLALKLLKSGGNITLVVDNLEKLGLVKRQRDEKDRRLISVYLTAEGTELFRSLLPLHIENIVRELGVLKRNEQQQLRRLCRKLGLKER